MPNSERARRGDLSPVPCPDAGVLRKLRGPAVEDHSDDYCPSCQTERVPGALASEELFPNPTDDTAVVRVQYDLEPSFQARSHTLARLRRAFDDARDFSELAFAVIVGRPGQGKSRTAREFARRVVQDHPNARILFGATTRGSNPYSVVASALRSRLGIGDRDTIGEQRAKLTTGVGQVVRSAQVVDISHLLGHLMGIPYPDSPVLDSLAAVPQQLEARAFISVKRFLAADAAKGPVVLIFKNLEACPTETINLLHYLAAGLSGSPVMLLGTATQALFERHPTFGEGETPLRRLDLQPLDPDEAEELLRALCQGLEEIPQALFDHLPSLDGSPRAIYELMRLLLETEVIQFKGGATWTVDAAGLDRLGLPDTHEDLVAERIRIMSSMDRQILEYAAIVGETAWLDSIVALVRTAQSDNTDADGPTLAAIAEAGDSTRDHVAETLSRLIEREWLTEVDRSLAAGEREYRFTYPYLWAAVYEGIDAPTKRRCHRAAAQWLELRPQGRQAETQERVGRHFECAGDSVAAAGRYRRAADSARTNYFNANAVRLYSQALACLGNADTGARIHLWHDLGSIYALTGDSDAALGAFERMLRLSWVIASRAKAAVAFNKMGRVWRAKGDLTLALDYLSRALDLFEQSGDDRGIAGSLDDVGTVLYLVGRYDDAYEKISRALNMRGDHGDQRSIAQCLSNLGNIEKDRGNFAAALAAHSEALEIRREIQDRVGGISSLNNMAVLAYEQGQLDRAGKGWEEALSEAEDIGALPLQALALCNLGELARVERRDEEAQRRLQDALQISRDIDDLRLQVEAHRNLALLAAEHGVSSDAKAHARTAYEIAAAAGLKDNEGRALITLGEVLAGSLFDSASTEDADDMELDPADGYFRRGVDLLRGIGNDAELARGLHRYGCYKIEHGHIQDGRELLTEAQEIFTRLGMDQADEVTKVLASLA